MVATFVPLVLFWFNENIVSSICSEFSNYFVTSPYYKNFRMITGTQNVFSPLYITKGSLSWARMCCGTLCNNNGSCLAFNVYESEDSYVCELLPSNLCQANPGLQFIVWPGSSIWDKATLGSSQSCFEIQFPSTSSIPCSNLKPGCLGTWPSCNSCVRNCIECKQRYAFTGDSDCTFWPDGDAPYMKPISGLCYDNAIYLIKRSVSMSSGVVQKDYRMAFEDMNRVIRLGAYTILEFHFRSSSTSLHYRYTNSYIDTQGTLSNLTFLSGTSDKDILQLNGQKLQPTPFITVKNDYLGCGSFWLFDTNNGTSCPGGRISMLGTPKVLTNTMTVVLSTGIRVNLTFFSFSSLGLWP